MQCSVIEFGRNVLGFEDANSSEMDSKTSHAVIDMMEEQKAITNLGGTMRLGAYTCHLKEGSLAHQIYGRTEISERHRHRYEFNNQFLSQYEEAGMIATGTNPASGLVEIVEIPTHPFFIGVQFHPEYKSTVANPHPIFVHFVKAAIKELQPAAV
jgi:CTP synthase